MLTLLFFLCYLGLALILTALIYYPVFLALDAIWSVRPDRVFYRLAMIIAGLGFWPFVKWLGINNRVALGYALDRARFMLTVGKGLGIGIVILACHALVLILIGVRIPAVGNILISDVLYLLISALLTGSLVAFIEESFFRGALQYHMRRRNSVAITVVLTSLLYAALHFCRLPKTAPDTVISASSGWIMLTQTFDQYRNFSNFADSFLALFVAGLLLSLIRERNGNIALCIGIHAGWVMMIKVTRGVTSTVPESPGAWLIGSYDDVIGWAAAGLLAVVTLWYWRHSRVGCR